MTRNSHELEAALSRALRAVPSGLAGGVGEVADDVAASVSTAGGGIPAPPGQAPHLQSGQLASSIEGKSSGTRGTVSAGAPQAEFQEFGTSEMEPRPFFVSGVRESARRVVPKEVGQAIVRAQRK